MVWLHCPVVPKGKSKKLHTPWEGPFQIVSKLSDITYRIQDMQKHCRRLVVHFNHLKRCPPDIRLPVPSEDLQFLTTLSDITEGRSLPGDNNLPSMTSPRTRYATCNRRSPTTLLLISHTKYGTYFFEDGTCVTVTHANVLPIIMSRD